MARTAHLQRRCWTRSWGALACLVAYLGGVAECVPELLGFLCSLDPSHSVYVIREDSEVRLVLSHEKGRETGSGYVARQDPHSNSHQHGLATAFLCSLTGSATGEADHEATFARGAALEIMDDDDFVKSRSASFPADVFAGGLAPAERFWSGQDRRRAPLGLEHSPPSLGGVWSTVLII